MKFLFLSVENTTQDATEQAAAALKRKHGLDVKVSYYQTKQLKEGASAWNDFERDLEESDFFLGTMITQAEQVGPLEKLLDRHKQRHPDRAIVVLNSMPSLMGKTHMGNFEFQNLLKMVKSGPIGAVSNAINSINKLVKRDAKAEAKIAELHEEDEKLPKKRLKPRKPAKKGVHNGMVAMMRTAGSLLKLVPGQAQDLRAYILIMLYWLNCSQENLEQFFLFAIDKYVGSYKGPKLKYKDPIEYPRLTLFHPAAPGQTFATRADFDKWRAKVSPKTVNRPKVGLIMMRSLYLSGNVKHIAELVKQLELAGVEAVPCYAAGLDFRPAIETFFLEEDKKGKVKPTVDLVMNLSGFSLVGGAAENDADASVAQLKRLNRPVWAVIPLFFQTEDEWRASRTGLNPLQAAFQIAIPELEGAGEPRVYAASYEKGPDKTLYPLVEETTRLARRAARLVQLSHKPNAQKKISVVLFSFPPNKGNVGTAAYLSVFESAFRLLKRLKAEGYMVEVPKDADELRQLVVEGNSAAYGTTANLHTHLATPDYMKLFPHWQEIEPLWGPPPGNLLTDHQGLQILGRQFGNVLIAVQPGFGYEDDPMRLLMSTNAAPHHGFAAFYTYLDKVWQSDAVLHFGTHGAMEFMPGKQMGLSAKCWPSRLIGDLPDFYLYSVNNPSEGSIAKRRGYATLLSYLSPPMETAGLYNKLLQLRDTINVYRKALADGYRFDSEDNRTLGQRMSEGGGSASPGQNNGALGGLLESIIEQAREIELKSKIDPATDPDGYVLNLFTELLEIEERLIPSGLHIADEPPTPEMLGDVLNSIASFSRGKANSKEEARSLTQLIADSFKWNLEELREAAEHDNDALARWERLSQLQRRAVNLFIGGLIAGKTERGKREAAEVLRDEAGVAVADSLPMWEYLQEVAEALTNNTEISQIIRAFGGEFIEPSAGNDIVRNPAVLPTGRNIHALDPGLVPTPIARRNGEKSAKEMLARACEELDLPAGQYPETLAMVLWGTDNIKTDGEGVAQALYLIGARAVNDGLGKVSGVKLLSLAELGRPRLDMVMTVSGIFRDILPQQMELLDRAVRLAAQADESPEQNFIKKHVQEEMAKGTSFDEAVARVFSNAPGQYGANVNFMVDSSQWEDDGELSAAFLARKSFAYGIKTDGADARQLMESALMRVQISFQNVDSTEIGITDVDHYFEYLGGITKTVEKLNGGKRPPALLGDSLSATSGGLAQGNKFRTLDEAVRLEARTKLLNPKWYEGMLKFGYEGVREIEVRLTNTYGWSATADAVDNWVYSEVDNTFIKDAAMRDRLTQLNPYSFKGMVGRLLEANGRGFWDTDEATIDRLKEIYAGLEDEIEGLGSAPVPGMAARQ